MQHLTKKLAAAVACIAAASLALTACGGAETPKEGGSPSESEAFTIGSMIWNVSNPFYTNFIKGQQDAAAELGATLVLVDGKNDIGTEVAAIGQLVSQKVDAILVTPSDAVGIAPALSKAAEAGIPIFAVNNRADDKAADVVTFIGADDVEFGRQQAKLLVDSVGENAKVAYMMGALGTSAQLLRKQGFDEVLKDHPGIVIVEEQTANWDAAEALSLTQDWLGKYPKGAIDAIVDQGPEGANAAKYGYDSGRQDVKFIVGDYPLDVREGIEAGYIHGTVDQDPRPQGERSVEAAVQWLRGEKDKVTRPNEYLPLPIITKANVADYPPAWGG
ncbi:MAG: sugar ABC transporter substrate-binding protein [Bifidobacteriaceae bacterium]|jgi:ABC-type sugar transport system substrate-binding protein|nr:sugar ABC transporter substrate-binding protein [Bifidobacteriaceae bacterium]